MDALVRFESLRVAGVLDFCYWESAASVLALRLSSGTLEISLQPNARALVLKYSRSSDVTAQAYPQLAQSVRPCGDEVVAAPTTNGRCYYHLPKAIHKSALSCYCGAKPGPLPTSRSLFLAYPPHFIVSLSHGFDQSFLCMPLLDCAGNRH